MVIKHVYCSDWEGIYFNDELVAQGHSINLYDVFTYLKKYNIKSESIEISDELAERFGYLPNSFKFLNEEIKDEDSV